jgi:hypothetical protein
MKRELPSQEYLRMLLDYDHLSGVLRWKKRDVSLFKSGGHTAEHTCNRWNSHMADQEALAAVKGDGYRHGAIDGVHYASHRVIWKWMTGVEPDEVDHIDGDRKNNKWANLRSVPRAVNGRNLTRAKDNTSGTTGVRYVARDATWQAYIMRGRTFINLGSYKNIEDAVRARKQAEKEYGFHANHGREAATEDSNPAA